MMMPPRKPLARSIGRLLPYLASGAGVHVAGVLAWHFLRSSGLAHGVGDEVQVGLLTWMWGSYAWLAVLQAVRSPSNGVLLTSLTLGSAFHLSDLVLFCLGFWLIPGLYQIDYDRSRFFYESISETAVLSWIVAALVAAVAAVAIAAAGMIRGFRVHRTRVGR